MVINSGFISRVAFSFFGVDIYWYALLICLGMILGFIWAWKHDSQFDIKFNDVLDLSLIMIPIGIISARAYYVLFNLDYYMNDWTEIFNFRNGGLAIYGGIIGAAVTAFVFCKIRKIKVGNLFDYLVPVLPLAQAIGRWGNYINVEAYGAETDFFIRMKIVENGITKYVHPTFLYESICNFIIFIILWSLGKNRKFEGQLVLIYFIGYSFIRFFIEGLRSDSLMLGSFRISQVLSAVIFVVSLFLYFILKYKSKKKLLN